MVGEGNVQKRVWAVKKFMPVSGPFGAVSFKCKYNSSFFGKFSGGKLFKTLEKSLRT